MTVCPLQTSANARPRRAWRPFLFLWIALLAPAVARGGDSVFQWTTNYYSVTGGSIHEIRRSIEQARPWKEKSSMDAYTLWSINWRISVASSPDDCRLASFSTKMSITTTLPRWTPPADAPPELKEAWLRYLKPLQQHEAGHAQIALTALAALHKRIKEVQPAESCDQVIKAANDLANRIVDEYRKKEHDWDRATNHGMKQGATFP